MQNNHTCPTSRKRERENERQREREREGCVNINEYTL